MFKKFLLTCLVFLMSFNASTVLAAVDLLEAVSFDSEIEMTEADVQAGSEVLDEVLVSSNESLEMDFEGILMQSTNSGLDYEFVQACDAEDSYEEFDDCKEDCKSPKRCVADTDACYYCKAPVDMPVIVDAPVVKKPGFIGRVFKGIKNVVKKAFVKVKGVFKGKEARQQAADEFKVQEEQTKQDEVEEQKESAQNRLLKYANRDPKGEHDKKEESGIADDLNDSIKNAAGVGDLFELGTLVNLFCGETSNEGQVSKDCEKLKAALKKRGNQIKEELYAKLQVGNLTLDQIKEINQLLTLLSAGEGRYFSPENVTKVKKGVNEKAYKALKKQAMEIEDLAELQQLFIDVHVMNGLSSNMSIFGGQRVQALHVLQHRARRLSMAALLAMDICDPDPKKMAALLAKLSNPPGCNELLGMPDVCQALKDGDAHQAYNLMYEHTKDNAMNTKEMKGPIDCDGKDNPKYTPQSFEDAKQKLREAIENGDEAEIARLKEILMRRFSESIAEDGFNDLFNDQKTIDELCKESPYKEHFKEECEKMRKDLLARGDKIKDAMLKKLHLEKLTDVEIHMIIISLKSGVAQYLDGVLVRGYFSPENVKKALEQIEAALKEMAGVKTDDEKVETEAPDSDQKSDDAAVGVENQASAQTADQGGSEVVTTETQEDQGSADNSEDSSTKSDDKTSDETVDVSGCMNKDASNYLPTATKDDGSCKMPAADSGSDSGNSQNSNSGSNDSNNPPVEISGCMDPNSPTYNSQATVDDGSCVAPPPQVFGCTNPEAENYFPEATVDDGSCVMSAGSGDPAVVDVPGCMDVNAPNFNPQATVEDGSCVAPIPGCTDSAAQNFIPEANVNDGSCVY